LRQVQTNNEEKKTDIEVGNPGDVERKSVSDDGGYHNSRDDTYEGVSTHCWESETARLEEGTKMKMVAFDSCDLVFLSETPHRGLR
jgi:hypothetical protein